MNAAKLAIPGIRARLLGQLARIERIMRSGGLSAETGAPRDVLHAAAMDAWAMHDLLAANGLTACATICGAAYGKLYDSIADAELSADAAQFIRLPAFNDALSQARRLLEAAEAPAAMDKPAPAAGTGSAPHDAGGAFDRHLPRYLAALDDEGRARVERITGRRYTHARES